MERPNPQRDTWERPEEVQRLTSVNLSMTSSGTGEDRKRKDQWA
nr:MAG TPA: hypothetical protein [Caudoviricetes sp.]